MVGFDPWGPISSLLFELSSDDVQRIVERAGLTPDWTLSKEEAYKLTPTPQEKGHSGGELPSSTRTCTWMKENYSS